ncbi:MAG TPA: hypothetical protein VE865_11110 [Bradyrhizobium sp.]|nr:hypothetical protein [Bradyrhizobium sp.]
MHYDIHRHDSRDYLSSDATQMVCDIVAEREGLAASRSDQRETRQVMEELLRECLKRKPLR